MTLDEALAVCDRAKPNQYSRSEKIRWLSDADGLVQREILDYVEPGTFSGYDEETPGETVLLAPAPYEGLYEAYESLGWTPEEIDGVLQVEIPDNAYFNQRGITGNYHGGGNVLFEDASILSWIVSHHK